MVPIECFTVSRWCMYWMHSPRANKAFFAWADRRSRQARRICSKILDKAFVSHNMFVWWTIKRRVDSIAWYFWCQFSCPMFPIAWSNSSPGSEKGVNSAVDNGTTIVSSETSVAIVISLNPSTESWLLDNSSKTSSERALDPGDIHSRRGFIGSFGKRRGVKGLVGGFVSGWSNIVGLLASSTTDRLAQVTVNPEESLAPDPPHTNFQSTKRTVIVRWNQRELTIDPVLCKTL